MQYVMAVAPPCPLQAWQRLSVFYDLQHVRHDLAGMLQVRQAVDDGNGGIARQFLNLGVIIRADHDFVDIAGKDSRRVCYRLSAPKLHGTAVHDDACAAKLTEDRTSVS